MSTNPIGVSGQQGQQATVGTDAFSDVNLDDFLQLLVAELANQDPLNPMENSQILQQVSQMREIDSTERLSATLDSVLLGQNLSTANSLLGRTILGLDDEGQYITGTVDRVTIEDDKVKAHVGDHVVSLKNVAEVLAGEEGVAGETSPSIEGLFDGLVDSA